MVYCACTYYSYMSHIMRKLEFATVKTKVQISCAVIAQLISTFVFASWIVQSLSFVNPKFRVSKPASVVVQPGLCRTWSEIHIVDFLMRRLIWLWTVLLVLINIFKLSIFMKKAEKKKNANWFTLFLKNTTKISLCICYWRYTTVFF